MYLLKPTILTLLISTFTLSSFAHLSKAYSAYKNTKKEVIPPGTVKMNEGFFFDQTEIDNFSWLEYVYWNKTKFGETAPEYLGSLPDTTVWGENHAFVSNYFAHPAYQHYPVVGISYEQAVNYCSWRSDRVNEMLFAKKNKVAYHYYQQDTSFAEIPKVFEYRMPTEEEWNLAMNTGFSKKVLRKRTSVGNVKSDRTDETEINLTAPVTSYWPNLLGIYNLTGNVAEMLNEKGTAKGGSWQHSLADSGADKQINYTGPTNWLGFRCVCERVD